MSGSIQLKLATTQDLIAMEQVGDLLFDHPVKRNRAIEFLKDSRHHLVLAYHNDAIVGMASGFHYVHPDKDPTLFINEVGVIDTYQNKGIGRQIVKYLCTYAQQLGCKEAWVATENSNPAARKAYAAAGGVEDKSPIVLINFDVENQ